MLSSRSARYSDAPKNPISGPFKATRLWKDLVNHLYENANVKKRRILMKSHDDCFSGCNAVDTLLSYVQKNPSRFPNTSFVTRENIVRLCQSFIDAGVFECVNVGDDSEKRLKFEDSSSRLYRFDTKNKKEFFTNPMSKSSHCLNVESSSEHSNSSDIDHLPAKFSTLLTAPRSVEPVPRHKSMFSPFVGGHSRHNRNKRTSDSQTSDSDCENRHLQKKTLKLKRTSSFVGIVMKRSSSDSNLRKPCLTSSSESDSSSKRHSPGDHLSRGRLRLSQRLSFRKKSLRRSGHSSYHLMQPCVIQNPGAAKDKLTENDCFTPDSKCAFSRKDLKRRSSRGIPSSAVPSTHCSKVKITSSKPRQRKLTLQESSHIKRESVRVRLLQILDMPFVESFVISPTVDKKVLGTSALENNQQNKCTSMQYREVASAYSNDDPWIFSCLSVLRHIPNSYNILRKLAKHEEQKKKVELYFAIADHYNSSSQPLIDKNFNGIAQAIIDLLASRPTEKIMEAVQLFVHLLADSRLTELRHLCVFLHTVCTQNKVRLVHKGNNQALVIEMFTPAIIRMSDSETRERMGLDGCRGLVRFIVQHHLRVFMLPASVEMTVQRKIDLLEQGDIESPSLLPDMTFCSIITEAEYQHQRVAYTRSQLQEQYDAIQADTSLPPRKKKEILKKLQRQHPELSTTNNNTAPEKAEVTKNQRHNRPGPQTRSFLTLTRSKHERKPASSEGFKDASLDTRSEAGISVSERRLCKDQAHGGMPKYMPPLSMRFTAPNSDPLSRKRRKNTRSDIYV